jgi:uncharacterized membrane protein YfcA
MPVLHIVYALTIGLLAGVSSGLFGIGGGVIIVPLLLYLFNYAQQTATATSLVALLLPVGIFGIITYWRAGHIHLVNIKIGLIIAIAMFAGTFFGAKIASGFQSLVLTRMFAVFLVLVAVRLWITAK